MVIDFLLRSALNRKIKALSEMELFQSAIALVLLVGKAFNEKLPAAI